VQLDRWSGDEQSARSPRARPGTKTPRAIAWFGFSAFWGHLRHLAASAIATDNIDSRQWMIPEAPDVLLAHVLEVLGGDREARTLAEGMTGGEVWIDFVADTGDDVTVSRVVAEILAQDYEVDGTKLPRGDILFLGGDLAYPVGTVREITRRVLDPWNEVLRARSDGKTRVLLGVPGNHDWYDGLDGFARLCQAPCAFEDRGRDRSSAQGERPDEHPVLAWAEAFARGDQVKKPSALRLAGYVPVQRASYFRIPLAPALDLFAVDRQLKRVDERQAAYFAIPGARARLVVVPDPARAWGETREHGAATLESLGIDMSSSPSFLLAGDVHHYERSEEGPSVHVVSGGGGAFLHGSRVTDRGAAYRTVAEFPGPRASWKLLRALPLHCALGRAGFILTAIFALANALALASELRGSGHGASLTIGLIVAIGTAMLVGWRRHRIIRVVPFATTLGLSIGIVPVALGKAAGSLALQVLSDAPFAWTFAFVGAIAVATFASSLLFGGMLMLIARLGLNHAQAYAALGSAGYKHFVRLRVTAAPRSQIDAWIIGVVDPIADARPVLVDTFTWGPHRLT
jgi:hypothetical protein